MTKADRERRLCLLVGTEAEFIKMMPVMRALERRGAPYQLVLSGQNPVVRSALWPLVEKRVADVVLSEGPRHASAVGLAVWALWMVMSGAVRMRRHLRGAGRAIFVVHGDTVSTLVGAAIGRLCGATVCHVEAGLRSFNLLRPFPEELCRRLVSRMAAVGFCPNTWAVGNLRRSRIHCVNTKENTLIDALELALGQGADPEVLARLPEKYFVAVVHRQENLMSARFLRRAVDAILAKAREVAAVFILHRITEAALRKANLLDRVLSSPGIVAFRRLPYVTFAHVLRGAEFVVTDGGSNQEEAYYLGKPCLLLRHETERIEGLGANVRLMGRDPAMLVDFFREPSVFRGSPRVSEASPSEVVAEGLMGL